MSQYDGYDAGGYDAGGYGDLTGDAGALEGDYAHDGDYGAADDYAGYGGDNLGGDLDGYGESHYDDGAYGVDPGYGADGLGGGAGQDYAQDAYGDGYDNYGAYDADRGLEGGYDDYGGEYGDAYDDQLAADEAALPGYGHEIDAYGHQIGDLAVDAAGLAIDDLGHIAGEIAEHRDGLEDAGELGFAALAGGAAGYALGHHDLHGDGYIDGADGYGHHSDMHGNGNEWGYDNAYGAYGDDYHHDRGVDGAGYGLDSEYDYGHHHGQHGHDHYEDLAASTILDGSLGYGHNGNTALSGYDTAPMGESTSGLGATGHHGAGHVGTSGALNELERLNHLEDIANHQTNHAENALLREENRLLNDERLEDRIESRLENRLDARLAHNKLESRLENHFADERLENRLEDRLDRDRLEQRLDNHLQHDMLRGEMNTQAGLEHLENRMATDRLEQQLSQSQYGYYGAYNGDGYAGLGGVSSMGHYDQPLASEMASTRGYDRTIAGLDLAEHQMMRDRGWINELESADLARDARANSRVDALLLNGAGYGDSSYYGTGHGHGTGHGYSSGHGYDSYNGNHHHDHYGSVLPHSTLGSYGYDSHSHHPNVLHDHRHVHGDNLGSYNAAGRLVGVNPNAGVGSYYGKGYDTLTGLEGYNHQFDDFYYGGLSNLYTGYTGADLFGGGHGRSRGLHADPFDNEITLDYGWGRIQPLSRYGLSRASLQPFDVMRMDDLYLYEQALRADEAIDEAERLRRWNERLRWEEMSDSQMRTRWTAMSAADRGRLGLNVGGWWASRFGNHRINSSYGYGRLLTGKGGILARGLRRGSWDHYPLSRTMSTRYPMWKRGGLGLGRSLLNWLQTPSRTYRPSAASTTSRNLQVRNNINRSQLHSRTSALQSRNLHNKQATMIASARAGSSIHAHGMPTSNAFVRRPTGPPHPPLRPGLARTRSAGNLRPRLPPPAPRPPLAARLPHRAPGSAFMKSPGPAQLGAIRGGNPSLAARLASMTPRTSARSFGAARPAPPGHRPGYPPPRPPIHAVRPGMAPRSVPHPGSLPRPGMARPPLRPGMSSMGSLNRRGPLPPARGMVGRPPMAGSSSGLHARPGLGAMGRGPSFGRSSGVGAGRSMGSIPPRLPMSMSASAGSLSRDPRMGGGHGYGPGRPPMGSGLTDAPPGTSFRRPPVPGLGQRAPLARAGRTSAPSYSRGLPGHGTSLGIGSRGPPTPGYTPGRSLSGLSGTTSNLLSSLSRTQSRVGLPQPPQFGSRSGLGSSGLSGSRSSLLRPTPLTPGGGFARSASVTGSRTPLQSALKSPGAGLSAKSPLMARAVSPGPSLRPRASTMSMRARSPAPSLRAKSPAPSMRAKSPAPSILRAKSPGLFRSKSPFLK